MTAIDESLIPAVKQIVDDLGKTVTFTVSGGSSYDPATGLAAPTSTATYTLKVSPPERYETRYVDGELIRRDDLKCLLPSSGTEFVPALGMTVTIDERTWQAVTVSPIYSGEEICAYELQLRS